MADKQQLEDSFKKSLEDVVFLAEKLIPYCSTVTDLVEMARLAQSNEGQFKLVFSICTSQGNKR